MLLHMMAASAAGLNAACTEEVVTAAGKKKKKDLKEQEERSVSLSVQLSKSLPQLLDKYGVQPERLQAVLKLLSQLRLDTAQAMVSVISTPPRSPAVWPT